MLDTYNPKKGQCQVYEIGHVVVVAEADKKRGACQTL